jgi:hypothetical protein
MPQYLATYTADVNWWAPEQANELAEYASSRLTTRRASAPASSCTPPAPPRSSEWRARAAATWSRPTGPTPRPRRRWTGFYLLDTADLEESVAIAAQLPAARNGAVKVRPVIAAR